MLGVHTLRHHNRYNLLFIWNYILFETPQYTKKKIEYTQLIFTIRSNGIFTVVVCTKSVFNNICELPNSLCLRKEMNVK